MTVRNSSRELSERVEIEFHKRPNRFRRRVWWSALWLSVACLLWLGYAGARGDHFIYEGGDLAYAHRLFENDCAKCHTSWAPVERAFNLDFSDRVYSVENAACLACHPGSEHHQNQIPAHSDISCGHCHIEHQGDHALKRSPNRVCLECHSDLKSHTRGENSFAGTLTDFGTSQGHPEFAVRRVLSRQSGSLAGIGSEHAVLKLLEYVDGAGWRDRAKIRFNHAAHLKAETAADGHTQFRIVARGQKLADFGIPETAANATEVCQVCHTSDAEGRYMQPIVFEQHCRACHPLLFDNRQYPAEQVPHEKPDIVRGFLTDKYTLATLAQPDAVSGSSPARPIPGRRSRPTLSKDQTEWLAEQLKAAEAETLAHTHVLFGAEAKGGCAYCHVDQNGQPPQQWSAITPPSIPSRWEPHAIFSHQSHQMMSCVECHDGVVESRITGDVLLPGVELCRKCHSSEPAQPGPDSPARLLGASTDCVECHLYHDHTKDNFIGGLNPLLHTAGTNPDATSTGESSK
ncbi:hypothetical protein GC176_25050 [bacterium]|nr:hypothetical protein [bacterium]